MRRRLRLSALFGSVLVLVLSVGSLASAQDASDPSAGQPRTEVSDAAVAVGDAITVSGTGWPSEEIASSVVCGNSALRGSADCNQSTRTASTTDVDGRFVAQIQVLAPPVPCPCVVHTTSLGVPARTDVPIFIEGHPKAELVYPTEVEAPRLVVRVVSVDGYGPWLAWFGASPRRSVVVEVENIGRASVQQAQGLIKAGRSPNPSRVVAAYEIESLAPGEVVVQEVTVGLPAPAVGEYWVTASVDASALRFEGAKSASAWPLGLLALLLLLLQWPIWRGRNWVRDRFAEVSEASAFVAARPAALPESSSLDLEPALPALAAGGLAVAAAGLDETSGRQMSSPVPIVMGVAGAHYSRVPVHFEALPPGQTPVVTIEMGNDLADGTARLKSVTVGGDIELRMRHVEQESLPDAESEEVG